MTTAALSTGGRAVPLSDVRPRWSQFRLLAVAAVAVVAAVGSTVAPLSSFSRPPVAALAVGVLVGLSFVLVGLLAWQRRPENRTGLLMVAVGFAWFLPEVFWVDHRLAARTSQFFEFFYAVVLAHLFLAFPNGRLEGRRERLLVGGLYGWWLTASILAFGEPRTACSGCPLNLLPSRSGDEFQFFNIGAHVRQALRVTDLVLMVLFVVVLAVVVDRWRKATRVGRRALAPVFWASFPAFTLVIALEVGAATQLLRSPLAPYLWWAGPAALTALPALFLLGVLRTRLAHSAVSELMIKLGEHPPPGRLQGALAETLGDPSVELAYWLPDKKAFVDSDGSPVQLQPRAGRVVRMLENTGEPVAALTVDASLEQDRGLVESVATAARLALENERLHAKVLAQLEEVRAQRLRLVDVGYEARRRIERDLHDGAQQRFVAVLLGLRTALLRADGDDRLHKELHRVADELKEAIDELRALVQGIYPPILKQEGLRAALLTLAERTPLPVELSVPEQRYPERVESTVYFVVSEALTNAVKHAAATGVEVEVAETSGGLVVRIEDDGRGGADLAGGSGLHGLVERVEALDGRLTLDSPPGDGTRIVAEFPRV